MGGGCQAKFGKGILEANYSWAISNNVGGVKLFSSVVTRAVRGAHHFARVEQVP
jgi:hypothetical protein